MVVVAIVNELDVGDGDHVGITNDAVAVVAGVSGISRGEMGLRDGLKLVLGLCSHFAGTGWFSRHPHVVQ